MKKLVLGTFMLSMSSAAFAEAPGGPDCGWGNLLFDGKSGLVPHMAALTTNGTSGNQTFGMTFGTNGCSVEGDLSYGGESMISGIMDELIEDVARGHGEALIAVATIMGVEKSDRGLFAQVSHENFKVIFPHENVTAKEVVDSLKEVMKSNPKLAKYAA